MHGITGPMSSKDWKARKKALKDAFQLPPHLRVNGPSCQDVGCRFKEGSCRNPTCMHRCLSPCVPMNLAIALRVVSVLPIGNATCRMLQRIDIYVAVSRAFQIIRASQRVSGMGV